MDCLKTQWTEETILCNILQVMANTLTEKSGYLLGLCDRSFQHLRLALWIPTTGLVGPCDCFYGIMWLLLLVNVTALIDFCNGPYGPLWLPLLAPVITLTGPCDWPYVIVLMGLCDFEALWLPILAPVTALVASLIGDCDSSYGPLWLYFKGPVIDLMGPCVVTVILGPCDCPYGLLWLLL